MNTRTAQTGNTSQLGAQAHGTPAPASDAALGAVSAWAMAGLLAGPFLSMVDSSIVNVALPDIARQVQSPLATAQWITSGYLLALAVVLPATAFLAKRFGTRRVYLVSLAGFTLASTACAIAPNIAWLIGARVVQGALGAPLVPLAMNLLLGRRGKARQLPAAAGMLLFLAPALGPSAGGLLIHVAGWPLIFLVNAPFGLLGILGLLRSGTAAEDDGDGTARFDPIGLVMLAAGFGLAIYGATLSAQGNWLDRAVWPFWAAGACLLAVYLLWAVWRPHPAVDLKLLRHPQSALALLLSALTSLVMFAMLFLLPFFMQDLQGSSPVVAGLALVPQGLLTGVGTVLGGALAARLGVRWTVLAGMLILAISTASLLTLQLTTPAWQIAVLLSGRGIALGLTIQPLLLGLTGTLSAAELADGNTLFNVVERLSGSVGIALLATFFQAREQLQVGAVLQRVGVSPGAIGSAARGPGAAAGLASVLTPALREQLAAAALRGFQETIWVLIALAVVGCVAALLLPAKTSDALVAPAERAPAEPVTA